MMKSDAAANNQTRHLDLGEITPRSVIAGIVASIMVSIWCPQSAWLVGASRLNGSQLPVAAFGLFMGVMLLNVLVGRISRRAMFAPTEILVIFVMSFIASVMATADLLDWVFSVKAVPYYLATPENRWMDDLWPHLKQWAVVQGPSDELRWAFVGMPEGASIPWRIWAIPSFWWGTFIGAVAFSSTCLAVILRKQWADHERLAFPLVQVPLDIMSNPGGKWNIPEMMRSRVFWSGAIIPLFIILFNCINYFEPTFPRITILDGFGLNISKNFPDDVNINLNLYVVGFAYMVNTNILFSVWFWHILVLIERTIFHNIGYTLGPHDDLYSSRDGITCWQGFGGFIVFVLWSLWMGRKHIRLVVLSAIGKAEADDEKELMPYRWAVPGLLATTLYMAVFLNRLGMTWQMVAVYLFAAFIAFVGTTRVIAQTGLVYMQSPLTPTMFTFGAFGSVGVPAAALVGMVGTYSLVVNGRAPLMPAIFHVSWLGAKIGTSGRKMFAVLVISLVVAYLVGTLYMIYISYTHGASTFHAWPYPKHGEQVYDAIIKKVQARDAIDPGRWMFLGIGAAVMTLLSIVQYRFPGWPLHPIGFPIAAANNIKAIFFSIFLAWMIKTLLLHLGGVERYEKARPFFMGLIGGYALGIVFSFFIDWIWFPGTGHQIHG
jgi:hypothetical protein